MYQKSIQLSFESRYELEQLTYSADRNVRRAAERVLRAGNRLALRCESDLQCMLSRGPAIDADLGRNGEPACEQEWTSADGGRGANDPVGLLADIDDARAMMPQS